MPLDQVRPVDDLALGEEGVHRSPALAVDMMLDGAEGRSRVTKPMCQCFYFAVRLVPRIEVLVV